MRLSAAQGRVILKAVASVKLTKDEQTRLLGWVEHLWTEHQGAPKGAKDTKAARRELQRLHGYTRKLLDVLDWGRAWPGPSAGPLSKEVVTTVAVHKALVEAMGVGAGSSHGRHLRATAEVRRAVQALEALERGLAAAEPAATGGRPPGKRDLIRRLATLLRGINITPTHRQNEPLCLILAVLDAHADPKDIAADIKAALPR